MSWPAVLVLVLLLAGLRLGVDALATEVVGSLGALVAALSFAPGDPPRRPWLVRAVAVGLVLLAHLVQRAGLVGAPRLDYVLLIVANLLGAAAVLGFLHNVRKSGLAAPLTGAEALAAGALACATLGVVAWILASLVPDSLRAAAVGVSTLADAVVFMGSALLLRFVLPMRGGLVAQPYLLLALDGLCFLLIDLAHALEHPALAPAIAPLGALGGAAGAAAGFAQAALVRRGAQRAH